jgi:parvulin-like peptidyl-prolyl isomerase
VRTIATSVILALLIAAATPAAAAWDSPVASKDGTTFTVEDLSIYWLRNLGKDGLLDFFQTMAVYQEGLRQGLKPTVEETEEFITERMDPLVYEQFSQLYSQQALDQLVEYTIVTSKYETWLRDKILREKNISVTEEEARQYFLNNIDQFHLPEGVYISLISVDNQSQANAVVERLRQGENFNDIASEVNLDPELRAVGGELGPYRKGDGLPEPLEQAALALQEGQYSEIIKGTNYHIVYCHKRYAQVNPTFEEIRDDLIQEMVQAEIDPYYVDELNALMQREMPRFCIMAELFRPVEE